MTKDEGMLEKRWPSYGGNLRSLHFASVETPDPE